MNLRQVRWLSLAVSTAASLALGWWILRSQDDAGAKPGMRFHRPAGDAAAGVARDLPVGKWLDPGRPEAWKYYVSRKAALKIYPIADKNNNRYDPWTYTAEAPNQHRRCIWPERAEKEFWWHTNGLGLREDQELADPPADVRVLVAGDSHTAGACNNGESHPNLLERALADLHPGKTVEVLNAAMPGFSFYQYSGTLHKFLAWRPQLFVVAVYGGNDFTEISYLSHVFTGAQQSRWRNEELELRDRALEAAGFAMGQCFNSIFDMYCRPEERDLLLRRSVRLCSQMQAVCQQQGIPMLVVFLPAACDCEWREPHADIERANAVLGLGEEERDVTAWFAETFVTELARLRIQAVDMRPIFALEKQPPYWSTDLHMNLRGHQLVADALLPEVERALSGLAR